MQEGDHNRKVDYLELEEHKLHQSHNHLGLQKHPDHAGNGDVHDDVRSLVNQLGHKKWPKLILMEPEIVVKSCLKHRHMWLMGCPNPNKF